MMRKRVHLIEPEVAQFPMTYLNSVSKLTVKMVNNDGKLFRYEWRTYPSEAEEQQRILSYDSSDPVQRQRIFQVLLFHSDCFSIDPISSEVWPGGCGQFVINFAPKEAKKYVITAYLYNKDTQERIPFEIRGEGLPATAELSVDQINIGHVHLGRTFNYAVTISNVGQLPCNFALIERKLPFLVFHFTPSSGHLSVGESKQITITFEASRVGQFSETFEFNILGVEGRAKPKITFYGKVIGPSLHLSKDLIDFGRVSVGFLHRQEFELENMTDIPCDFSFSLDNNQNFQPREFAIIPNEGTIGSFSKMKVAIEFIPINVQNYEVNIVLDSVRFEERLATLPAIATCVCPGISLVSDEMDLGRVFIGYQYTKELKMRNTTPFPAKFEFVEVDDESTLDATVTVGKYRGVVPENRDSSLPVMIKPIQLGHLDMWRYVRIIGSSEPPLQFKIKGLCVGPNIKLSMDQVDFGNIGVLHDVQLNLGITNDSLIPAPYKAEISSETGVFRIEKEEGEIPPGETLQLPVIAFLDDTINYTGQITLTFRYLPPMQVNVSAKGTGTAIVSSIEMKEIDFVYLFTGEPVVKTFTLENKGRRSQEIKWAQAKPQVESETEAVVTYTLSPETKLIAPKEIVQYTITLFCQNACTFHLKPQCTSTIGKARLDLFQPDIHGVFINPSLIFGMKTMSFRYVHDIEKEEQISGAIRGKDVISPAQELLLPITYSNTITNKAKLPVRVVAKCPPHFTMSKLNFDLNEDDTEEFEVTFHTNFKRDFTSQTINDKIMFSFIGIPQTYTLPLQAVMLFPNVSISEEKLNFGRMMKHTEQTKVVLLRNISEFGIDFEWELLPSVKDEDISKVFDVYPIRGHIDKDDSMDIHVTFFALSENKNSLNSKYNGLAVCHITGGPDYTIKLSGSSADLTYKLTNQVIDFGDRFYSDILTSSVCLTNDSDVPLVYKVKIPRGCQFLQVQINPMNGSIPPKETQQFDVRVCPGYPKSYKETFFIQIGQFDEAEIGVRVNCCFPHVQFSMERTADDPVLSRSRANLLTEEKVVELERTIFMQRLNDMLKSPTFVSALLKPADIQTIAASGRFNGFVAGRFGVDMGSITLGEPHTIKHTMKSLCNAPLNAELIVNSLAGTGFSIEPTSIEGLPKDSELALTFSFDASTRTTKRTGTEVYEIPMVLNQDLGYIIELRALISMPSLEFSKSHFDFEPTLVGQTRVQSFQMQNTTSIPIEFSVGDAESCVVIKRSLDKSLANIFTISPKSGLLPPSAFQNFEITFAPTSERLYSLQFPIRVVHNTDVSYLTARGSGVYMKVAFDPPEVVFPQTKPYEEPLTTTVTLINPCTYPIEIYSPQFDFQILCEQLKAKWSQIITQEIPDEETPADSEVDMVSSVPKSVMSRFSMCVIVNGPPKSGKTTVSKMLSEYLQVPVIVLRDVWNDETEDYAKALANHIEGLEFSRGFVIDGLECLPEPPETQTWLAQAIKVKAVNDELNKNPFAKVPGSNTTAAEQALSYILGSLDMHYVFHIALSAKEEVIENHEEIAQEEARREQAIKEQLEIDSLFNMTEEEYGKLTDEERAVVDEKRTQRRLQMLAQQIEAEVHLTTQTSVKHNTHEPRTRSTRKAPRKSLRGRLQLIAHDPNMMGLVKFTFTLGRVTEMVKEGTNFKPFDPALLQRIPDELGPEVKRVSNTLLIDVSVPKERVFNIIQTYLPRPEEIKKQVTKLIPKPRLTLPKLDMSGFMPAPKQFCIISQDPPGELPLLEIPQTHARGAGHASKRKVYEQQKEQLLESINVRNYTKRWILEPGAKEQITVQFSSNSIGTFEDYLAFRIKDCRDDVFRLNLKGVAVYPDIARTPEIVFGKVVKRLTSATKYSYVTSLEQFHFGPLLISSAKSGKNAHSGYKHPIKLLNNSEFPAEMALSFAEPAGRNLWSLDRTSLVLQPGELSTVNLCFNPTVADMFRNRVNIFIKDNPEVFSFECAGTGCVPTMELSVSQLDFEKLLLRQPKTMQVELRNTSRITIMWRIKAPNQISGLFTVSSTEGILAPRASQVLSIDYCSDKPQSIKKAIQFEVMDKNRAKVYQTKNLALSAESFDVNFDIIYPKGMNHLNFGTFKVFQDKQISCTLRNKGKYPTLFKLRHLKPAYRRAILMSPSEGTIPPGDKGTNVVFTFSAKQVYNLASARLIGLKVFDSLSKTEIVDLSLYVTTKAVFSEYVLEPANALDFGAVAVDTTTTKDWIIRNCGAFPFEFTISPKIEAPVSAPKTTRGKAGAKRGKTASPPRTARPAQKKRRNAKDLQIGQFVLLQSSGVVAPDSFATVRIEFFNSVPELATGTLLLKLTDVDPADPTHDGRPFLMKASTHIPALDLRDMEPIFPNQHLSLRCEVQKREESAYLEDDNVFHFSPTIINQSQRIEVALINAVPVTTTVDIVIKHNMAGMASGRKSTKGQPVDQPLRPFTVEEACVSIEPSGRRNVGLVFSPLAVGKVSATFTATVKGGVKGQNNVLKFNLEGTGTLPTIAVLDTSGKRLHGPVSFGRTLIDSRKEKLVTIRNDGIIASRLAISADASADFSLENHDFVRNFTLEPQKAFNLIVAFYPKQVKKSTFHILVEVLDNPAANADLNFIGEGFVDDVIFEGIPGDENELVFHDNVVGRQQQISFIMKNVCANDIRFNWVGNSEFKFSPNVGHLHRGQSKRIFTTFFSDKPVRVNNVKALCQWSKIELTNKDAPDWDDSMKNVKFIPKLNFEELPPAPPSQRSSRKSARRVVKKPPPRNIPSARRNRGKKDEPAPPSVSIESHPLDGDLMKVVEVLPEPPYTVIAGKTKDLLLKISAVADYIRYSLSTNEIAFSPTMMFETRTVQVKLTNTSQIRLDYLWMPRQVTSLQHGDDKFQTCPFSVMPRSGVIEAGSTATFDVRFSPDDVDNYTAHLVCEIPFLSQMPPPDIYVSGISRRPLCHFNVKLSDYITAGRRHPDYTYPLPDNIKVIEIFARGAHTRAVTKFEIINATAYPYEVFWEEDPEHRNPVISCEYPRMFISSGKRSVAMFSYEPVSVRTVESVWIFTIPEHNVKMTFLIVGRIMPH